METEYLCITILAKDAESEAAFKIRISEFWTTIVRGNPDLFEKVYAETTEFEEQRGLLTRKYLVEAEFADEVAKAMTSSALDFLPLDPDDLYTKYEAAPPEWFWIEY